MHRGEQTATKMVCNNPPNDVVDGSLSAVLQEESLSRIERQLDQLLEGADGQSDNAAKMLNGHQDVVHDRGPDEQAAP